MLRFAFTIGEKSFLTIAILCELVVGGLNSFIVNDVDILSFLITLGSMQLIRRATIALQRLA
jgi:ribose/xylose/arabinose/galactoside ABC-type transport system permease subunit